LIGLMSGEVDMICGGTPTALPQIQAGKVKALVILGKDRVSSLPNVPTAKEAGVDNWEATAWFGIMAPAGTPRFIVDRLSKEWIKLSAMPDIVEMMKKADIEPISSTPEQFTEFIKTETVRWSKVIKEANIPRVD
jgi:tripartite-type tricarboxylate transporter receptor subunit TctC